jgi:hypothetical protein
MKRASLWKQRLERLLESPEDRDPRDLIKALCELAAFMGEDAGESLLAAYPELYAHAPRLTEANNQRVEKQDIAEVQRIFERSTDGPRALADVASASEMTIFNRVSGMFSDLDFSGCRRLVMVGCGRLPSTAFLVHDRTEIPEIVCLDKVAELVAAAQELADRLGYLRVRFEHYDGSSYDYDGSQIVYVALMTVPKAAVLSRIADSAPREVRIVVREPVSLARLWTESAGRSLDPRLEVIGKGKPGGFGSLSQDVYLRRRPARVAGWRA